MYHAQDCGRSAKSSAVGVPSLPMKPRLTLWLAPVPDREMLCRERGGESAGAQEPLLGQSGILK